MTATLHACLLAHGIAVIGEVDLPAPDAHAHLREALRHPVTGHASSDLLLRPRAGC
jgi:hypothetical protein